MNKKILYIAGIILLLLVLQSCSSKPEETLLKKYFQAVSLNDITTISTMAMEPITLEEVKNWKIVSATETRIEPAILPELNKKELELKKELEKSVGITLDARDEVDDAKYDLSNARTRASKREAGKKVDELQAKYDEIYERHKTLQEEYNKAKSIAAIEEEITSFSVSAGEVSNIRELSGEVESKEVDVEINSKLGIKTYKFYIRKYTLEDEGLKLTRRGRWIIVKFEPLD